MAAPQSPDAIELHQANTIFAAFATDRDLALRFPADGCYARTHIMVQRLREQGLSPSKVWAFAASAADLLWIETPYLPEGRVQWAYHVAVVLVVKRTDSEVCPLAFDPMLFDHPVPLEEWQRALHDTPTLVTTAIGEPPLADRGGSGYWPGPDPLEGPDVHAFETLEEYRQWNA